MSSTLKERRSKLLQHISKIGCNSIAAFQPENVFYLTQFWGEAVAICIVDNDKSKIITPKLETDRAQQSSKDCEIISTERGGDMISSIISELNGKLVCTDCDDYHYIDAIRNKVGRKSFLVNSEPFFQIRRIKDQGEIRTISKAAKILDTLYQICKEEIKLGLSERDLQAKLIFEAMKLGANPPSYRSTLNPLIIAGGPNSSLPHAEVSNRQFMKGDMIIVDLTLRYDGYIADATRTFALVSATSEMKKVYEVVKQSQQAGLNAVNEGSICGDVDAACRNVISKSGYAKYFIHSTGHGIGLDVHEPPWLRIKNQEILKANMSVTIEPGIYLRDKFGVRIEDSIIVNGYDNGYVMNLNTFTKDLIVLG
jgi:Xaa-Pro aminopeptidase/Xaa-Pro dipeptidase